jgi:EpsD family peptidyl-prolyl cis-trans isomerase
MACVTYPRRGVKWFLMPSPSLRRRVTVFAAAAFAALSGCDGGDLSGQVIAVVDGEEITIPELNAEARARGLVIGSDRAVRDRLLQDLIERKLLVHAAASRQLDRTPEHVLAKRRSDEMLLAGELLGALGRQRASLSGRELAQFIAANPYAFDKRMLVTIERVSAQTLVKPELRRSVDASRSLDEAQALLASKGVAAERRVEVWDSATFTASMARQLLGQQDDETLLLELPGQTVIAKVIEAVPQPTPAPTRTQFARELLGSQRSQHDLQTIIQREKSSAKIRYHPRFAPHRMLSPAGGGTN